MKLWVEILILFGALRSQPVAANRNAVGGCAGIPRACPTHLPARSGRLRTARFIGDLVVDDDELGGHADLTLIQKRSEDHGTHGFVDVRVIEDDERDFPLSSSKQRFKYGAGVCAMMRPDPGRPGEVTRGMSFGSIPSDGNKSTRQPSSVDVTRGLSGPVRVDYPTRAVNSGGRMNVDRRGFAKSLTGSSTRSPLARR
jgi:hypothetical protein